MTTERRSHPCLRRGCRHPDSDHVATPELAGPREIVVWCFGCRRHETRGPRRWFLDRFSDPPSERSVSQARGF